MAQYKKAQKLNILLILIAKNLCIFFCSFISDLPFYHFQSFQHCPERSHEFKRFTIFLFLGKCLAWYLSHFHFFRSIRPQTTKKHSFVNGKPLPYGSQWTGLNYVSNIRVKGTLLNKNHSPHTLIKIDKEKIALKADDQTRIPNTILRGGKESRRERKKKERQINKIFVHILLEWRWKKRKTNTTNNS